MTSPDTPPEPKGSRGELRTAPVGDVLSTLPAGCRQLRRDLRQQLRRYRRAIPQRQQAAAAVSVAQRLAAWPRFQRARCLTAYLAADGEIDPFSVIALAWQRGVRVHIPKLLADGGMTFIAYCPGSRLVQNRLGIAEPVTGRRCNLAQIDCMLMPLVGFDRAGHRLGMGGGYYDRFLARTCQRRAAMPLLVGVAHAGQELAHIDIAAWDVPVDAIVTDRALIVPGRPDRSNRRREVARSGRH